jgi:hypothetical protein
MDRNAYRDDNGTDQLRLHADHPRSRADAPSLYPDEDDSYPGESEPYPDQPDTYWRRRIATLAAGLGVLGLLAWAFSGGGGKPTPTPGNSPASGALAYPSVQTSAGPGAGISAGTSTGTNTGAGAGPSAGTGAGADAAIPGLGSRGTSGLPSATTSPAARSARSARPGAGAGASAAQSGAAKSGAAKSGTAPASEPGGRCSPSSVVLSLFSGSRSYRSGQDPQFGVDAVSTAPGTCTFDVGPGQLHLVVMSAGRVIWDSADCARGGTQTVKLTRGVPVQEYFTWNRSITLPGCVTLASSARRGSYQAQARTPAISSGTFAFRLVR